MATATLIRGTVRVGRWQYPAELEVDGRMESTVRRNTKRDGSGEWEPVDTKVQDTFVPAEETGEIAVEIPGFVDEAPVNHDREDLRKAYDLVFDDFASTLDEVSEAVDANPGRTKAILNELVQLGLVVQSEGGEAFGRKEVVWQAWQTYDNIDRDQATALFEEKVPADIKVRAVSSHGGKVGAQTKKPGKSTWGVGDKCPQGHKITDDKGDNPVYVQPSGRKQCRKCRSGYASNA